MPKTSPWCQPVTELSWGCSHPAPWTLYNCVLSLTVGHTVLRASAPCSPFAWQSLKSYSFYFTQNSVSVFLFGLAPVNRGQVLARGGQLGFPGPCVSSLLRGTVMAPVKDSGFCAESIQFVCFLCLEWTQCDRLYTWQNSDHFWRLEGALNAFIMLYRASLVAQMVKNLPATQETQVQSLAWEVPLEKV